MTTYTHKKSLRHITDEQFSEKTTVDGNRIDKALQESVERVNSIRAEDVLSRYTESKFVFGYRPNRDYAACAASGGGHYYAHHFPWMQIANSADLTLGAAQVAQNPKTVKTVRLSETGSDWTVGNGGPVPYDDVSTTTQDWEGNWNLWAAAPTAAGNLDYTTVDGPGNGYQYAYTNSWNFNKAAVIDDLMIAFTVDSDKMLGSLVADTFSTFADVAGANGTDVLGVVLMVDNHFSQELREDSEIEVAANGYDLLGFQYSYKTFSTTTDMAPAMPPIPGSPFTTLGLNRSIVVRWRDLNIPLHEGARVRLSIVIPWTLMNLQPNGLTYIAGGAEVGTAPFFYASPRGCMTVLEELEA
tara:strand:+ start:3670 stop:4737 length:1068 start_codon:yes stop_codon:yes gene_type:complete